MRGCRHDSRKSKWTFQIFCDLIWFFGHTKKMQKINNKIKNKEHNKDKNGNKKRNTTTKKKKNKTPKEKKTRWVTLLQWTRYTKTIRDREETKGTTKKTLHVYFGAVGLQPFLVFCVFVFCKNTVFPLETGYFVHFSVSPFLSPWLLSLFLFHSLSLLFLVFFVYSLLYCWFLLLCFFVVLSCLVSLRLFHEKNITFERFLFINYFCLLGVSCFALPFKSLFLILFLSFFQLCVLVNIHVFIFQRRTFLKHSVLFCALCKVIVFVKGRFWGQIRLMFKKHCKNRQKKPCTCMLGLLAFNPS